MTQSDLFAWSMEQDPTLRSTIVTVLVLDTEPDWDRLLRMLDRGTRAVPRFRHRLVTAPWGLTPPRWIPDPDFDLSWHVRHLALPAPADLSSVIEFARTEVMSAFDPARPLWRFTVLGGLDGGKSALLLKVHHSLTDGVGGIQIAGEILDFTRAGTVHEPVSDPARSGDGLLGDIVAWNWSAGADLVRTGLAAIPPIAWRAVTDPVGAVRDGAAVAESLLRLARPITRTLSPLMTERSLGRRLTVLEVPLETLRRGARLAGCTVNDAYLASVLIGLRAYHERHGKTVEQLRVAMPISLRRAGDPLGGNRITLARFAVPVGGGAADLMRALDATVARWRHEPAIPLSNAVAATFNRLPVGLLSPMFKHVDFIASDVPGSPVELYVAGAKIERIYPFGPTTGTAFNITLISHTGTCCIGINSDTAAVPDPAVLAECLAAGFRTVTALDAGEHDSPAPVDHPGPPETAPGA
ncbi:wax ester/triacylglycerol synthase domain-containing protein [Nocardia sp. NPDC004582]